MKDQSIAKLSTEPLLTKESISFEIPARIGPYRIKSLFNKGGMSLLYLATNENGTKPLIIKVLPSKYANNKEISDLFLKEAKIISMSKHPNIIRLYGQGKWENGLYIAMEFIQGISLKQFILTKAFSQKKALEIILQVSYALCHLHDHNIIHRDLKPENILITENGEVKVIDFGISQLKKDSVDTLFTKKRIIGTPAYMSPEQQNDPFNVTFQTDIFALGKITYELITGKVGKKKLELDFLPNSLKYIIEKTQEIDLKKRYQSMAQFITDISKYLAKIKEKPSINNEKYKDLSDSIDLISSILIPQDFSKYNNLEITIENEKSIFTSGFYLDLFDISFDKKILFFAENIKTGMISIHQTAILRGMVKAIIELIKPNLIKSGQTTSFLSSINQMLIKEKTAALYAYTIILFDEKSNKISLSSAGHGTSFLVKNSNKLISLYTPNQFLGSSHDLIFSETISNWNKEDNLFLFSYETVTNNKNKNHTPLKKSISANIIFPAKVMTKKILEEQKLVNLKRSAFIINIFRKS